MVLVSAVMPTRGRKELAAKAVECFLSQTWLEKELVILDDADCRSFDQPPEFAGVRYMIADKKLKIAAKRNIVCEAAGGDFIIHFDSDDWSAPGRIAAQVELMMQNEKKAVCGFRKMYFWDTIKKQAWIYSGAEDYVLGTSLMFKRSWWAHHQWNERFTVGSDNVFVSQAWKARQLIVSPAMDFIVSRNHGGNTNSRQYGTRWKKTNRELLPADFFKEAICQQAPEPVACDTD